MPGSRRTFLKHSLIFSTSTALIASGLFLPQRAKATWNAQNFSRGELADALTQLYKDTVITETEAIVLKLPKTAENGAVVPISVSSTLPKVTEISIFVAKNPTPLAATFKLSPDLDPFVSARIKMAETSSVIAIVTSDGKLFRTHQDVQVTIGGCGG